MSAGQAVAVCLWCVVVVQGISVFTFVHLPLCQSIAFYVHITCEM